jgi:hypothetical protein
MTSPYPTSTTVPYQEVPSVPAGFTPGSKIHLHFPTGKATNSTIVLLQGGGLTGLEPPDAPGQEMYDVANNLAQSLNALVVVPQYTVDPGAAAATPPEVVFASRDVGCAIAWVNLYAPSDLGASSKPLLVTGDSAGGQLASMMGTQTNTYVPAPANIGGVASMSGRYDFDVVPYDPGGVSAQGWVNMHGTGNSPIHHVQRDAYAWMLMYEQCDADQQYGNWARFSAKLAAAGNTVVNFEDVATPCPTHGTGLADLSATGNAFYKKFAAFEKYVSNVGSLPASPSNVENIPPTTASKNAIGFNDIAFGGDVHCGSSRTGASGISPLLNTAIQAM